MANGENQTIPPESTDSSGENKYAPAVPYAEAVEQTKEAFGAMGINAWDLKEAGWNMHDQVDPYGPNPFNAPEVYTWNEFEQGPVNDFLSGVYNTLVLGLGEGIADAIPTVAQAFGAEGEWADNWIEGTSEWFDKQQVVYSDSAYEPVKDWGDYFSSGKFWSTLGEGAGYIAGIMGGSGIGGAFGKAGYFGSNIVRGEKMGGRIGSFMTGTALMYGDLYDEAKELGFESKDAARIALSTAGVVSLTEGAALEWIGKGATNWIPKEIVKSSLRGAMKESEKMATTHGKFSFLNKAFSTKLMEGLASTEGRGAFRTAVGSGITKTGQAIGNISKEGVKTGIKKIAGATVRGGAIEFGQEFSQTYIEDGIKEMYDTFVTGTNLVDDSRMGSLRQFQDAVYGGIIGSILGGGMGGVANVKGSFANNRESIVGYMSENVRNKKTRNIKKLYNEVDRQFKKGKINEEVRDAMYGELDQAREYAEQTKNLNIQDPVANAQLYDIFKLREDVNTKLDGLQTDENVDPLVSEKLHDNRKMVEPLSRKIEAFGQQIVAEGSKLTKDRGKFDKMMVDAKQLYSDALSNKLTQEEFDKRLEKIKLEDGKQKVSDKQKSQETKKTEQKQQDDTTEDSVQEQAFKVGDKSYADYGSLTEALDKGEVTEEEFNQAVDEVNDRNFPEDKIGSLEEYDALTEEEVSQIKKGDEVVFKDAAGRVLSGIAQESGKHGAVDVLMEDGSTYPGETDFLKRGKVKSEENIPEGWRVVEEGEVLPAGYETKMSMSGGQNITNAPKAEKKETESQEETEETEEAESQEERDVAVEEVVEVEEEVEVEDDVEEGLEEDEVISTEEEVTTRKEKFVKSAKEYLKKTKESANLIKESVGKAYNIISEKGVSGKYTQEDIAVINEALKNVAKMVPQVGAAVAPIPMSATGLQILKEKIPFLKKVLTYSREALDAHTGEVAEKKRAADGLRNEIDIAQAEQTARSEIPDDLDFTSDAFTNAAKQYHENKEDVPKNQLQGFKAIKYDSRIQEDPVTYGKIRKHFQKIFPGVSNELVDSITDKYGNQALGAIVNGAIKIDRNNAMQSTLIHEYAEAYLDLMEEINPQFVKRGKEFVKGTDYHKQAQQLYSQYDEQTQLREALAQTLTENTLEKLTEKFGQNKAQQFVAWLKRFWNNIKDRFTNKNKKSIIEVMSNDMALRSDPLITPIPRTSSRYQLSGELNEAGDPAMSFISNTTNQAILLAKFNVADIKKKPTASDATYFAIRSLYDQYVAEMNNEVQDNVFNMNTIGVTKEDIQEKGADSNENLQRFFVAFKEQQPDRWNYINDSIKASLQNKEETQEELEESETDKEISKTVIKPEAKLSANTRTLVSTILDDVTGSPMSKDAVMRTILSASSKSYNTQQFMKELERRASGDLAAERLSYLFNNLPSQFKNPILRDLSSLGQKKATANIVGINEAGKLIANNRIVNNDHTQGDQVNKLAGNVMKSYRSGRFAEVLERFNEVRRKENPDNATKAIMLEKMVQDVFDIPNFSFKSYQELTDSKDHVGTLIGMFNKLSDDLPTSKTIKDVVKDNKSYFMNLAVGESEINALSNSYVNTAGKRAPSYKPESSFSTNTKVINNPNYVKRLLKEELYKDNPIVKMAKSGVRVEEHIHDAVSNMEFGSVTEYADLSKIDNKTVGLWEYMQAQNSNHGKYKQWFGTTADRLYMTQFTAPVHNAVANGRITEKFKESLHNLFKRDQKVMSTLKPEYDRLSEKDKATFREAAQGLTINTINENLTVTENKNPLEDGTYAADINQFVTELESIGLTKPIAELVSKKEFDMEDEVDQMAANKVVRELVQNYWANDYINRKSLEDIYTGPLERHLIKYRYKDGEQVVVAKDISEPIKRMGLGNSNGFLNELPGPARVVVLKMPSDSYGLNSPSLQSVLKKAGGVLDPVGANVKDGNFHVDHFDNGRTVSMKRSAFGLERVLDEQGQTIGTNADEMTPKDNTHPTSMKNMANALVAFEDHLKSKGMSDLITMVDTDVMKNDLPKGTVIMSDKEFVDAVNNGEFEKLMNNFPETKLPGYRTSFNLHKDPTKTHVSEQKVVRTVQGVVLASNNDTEQELEEIDKAYVGIQEKNLGLYTKDGETRYKVFEQLVDSNTLINAALQYADETNTTFQKELLTYIKSHNDNHIAYRRLIGLKESKTRNTSEEYQESLNKSIESMDVLNPMRKIYTEVVSDLKSNTKTFNDIVEQFSEFSTPIRTHDHPNLKFMMDAAIASRLTKKGIRVEMPGLYSVVAPDYNNDLQFHRGTKTEGGFTFEEVSDVAVPWSMFVTPMEGESDADARLRAETMLAEANETGVGLRVIAERVPTSGPTMIFPSKVKYFTDGRSNNVITPREFIDVSDSDHDGDKLFLYREEIDADGNIMDATQSDKSNLFNMMYDRFASQYFVEKTMTESVSVDKFKERVEKVLNQLSKVEEGAKQLKSIRTLEGASEMANSMKDGATGIGIFAVAVKTLSLMYQSGVKVNQKLTVDLGTEIEVDGKKISEFTIDKIDIENLETAALYLQSALDNAKEMALAFSGVTKDNMGTVSAMLISGMNVEEITAVLNNKDVKNYLKLVNADGSAFSLNPRADRNQLRSKKKKSGIGKFLKDKLVALTFNELKEFDKAKTNEAIPFTGSTKREDGVYRRAAIMKGKRTYFQLETIDGKQTIKGLSPEQAQDEYLFKNDETSNILTGYFKLEDIGNELSILTPVIQLDGGLANTGLKSRKIQKNIEKINKRDGFNFFDVDKLAERPRIRHLAKMNRAQRDILQEHFISEQESVYEAAETIMNNFSKGNRRSFDSVYGNLVESIHMMYAQKALLSKEAQKFNQGQLDNFVETFVSKIQAVQQLIDGVESAYSQSKIDFIMKKHEKRGYDGMTPGEQEMYNQMVKETELADVIDGEIMVKGQSVNLGDYLKANPFIQSLEVIEVNGKKKVVMKKSFASLSEHEKTSRKLGYNELKLVHPQLAKEILDYQVLNNGLNQKIGSYAELFPQSVHVQYLKELSHRTTFAKETANHAGVAKTQRRAYEINTALKYIDSLDKVKVDATNLNKKYYNVNGELYIYENKQVDPETGDLVQSPTKRLVPASKYNSFMTNGDYYKLGDLAEYAKIQFDTEHVTKKQIDELKKCIRANKFS